MTQTINMQIEYTQQNDHILKWIENMIKYAEIESRIPPRSNSNSNSNSQPNSQSNSQQNVFSFGHQTTKSSQSNSQQITFSFGHQPIDIKLISVDDPNKQFSCCKALLQTIPYFNMLLEDIEMDDNCIIIPDYDYTVQIIKLVYGLNIKCDDNYFAEIFRLMDASDYVEIFRLMDKYLMKDYFDCMICSDYDKIKALMEQLIEQKNFDKIKILHRILQDNVEDEKNGAKAKRMIRIMFQADMGDNFTMLDNWPDILEDHYKLKYIYKSGHYELLNIAKIKPTYVLKFLALHNFENTVKCSDIANIIRKQYDDNVLILGPNNISTHNYMYNYQGKCDCYIVMINNYYPLLSYTKITKLPVKILKNTENYVAIQFNADLKLKVKIGSGIIFNLPTLIQNIPSTYSVNAIYAYNDNINEKVSKAIYIPPEFNIINYKLFIDKKNMEENITNIWLVESM